MNFLNDKNTRLVLLAVVVVAVLVALNMNQKRVGKQVALLGTLATILVAVVVGHMLLRQPEAEGFQGNNETSVAAEAAVVAAAAEAEAEAAAEAEEASEAENVKPAQEDTESIQGSISPAPAAAVNASTGGCLPRDVLNPQELLPSANAPNAWDTPANPGGIEGPNFLNPEHLIGINTVGQSLRNANRQIRSEPPNPQVKVSPWLQSTIEPDTNRRPLEIGGCE